MNIEEQNNQQAAKKSEALQAKKTRRHSFGLQEAREYILHHKYKKDDLVLVRLHFTFEESQNKVTKKWIKSMIVQNLT